VNSNPADSDFAEHAVLEAETPASQCAWCDIPAAPNSDLCDTCQIEEMDRLAEEDYDDNMECGCCSCCGCSCDLDYDFTTYEESEDD